MYTLLSDGRLNHKSLVTSGVFAKDYGDILTEFFRRKREMGKK